jgi:hypothetical protein
MIQMRVRERYRLQLKPVPLKRLDDSFRLITRINTDGAPGLLAPDNARVLLKGSDGNLFDNHKQSLVSKQRSATEVETSSGRLIADR